MRKLLAGSAAVLLFVPVAAAGPAPPAPIDLDFKKGPGAEWIEYTSVRKNVGTQTETVFWRVRNRDAETHVVTLTEDLGGYGIDDYRIKWFNDGKEITQKVRGAGRDFKLKEAEKETIEVTIRAQDGNPDPVCITPIFDIADAASSYSYGLYVNDDGVCG